MGKTLLLLFYSMLLSAQPTIEWQKTYGGNYYDDAYSVQQTKDGGYILAGETFSTTGDVLETFGGFDFWIVKLDVNGIIQWKKTLGGTGNDSARSIFQTSDGGYFIAGYSESNDHDVSGNHGGFSDGWVVKLDSIGNIQWQKALGGSEWDLIWSAQQTSDKGYILTGISESIDGNLTENHGHLDVWVVKLDKTGAIEWQKTFGGSKDDLGYSIKQTSDSGYIIACETASMDGDVTNLFGNVDFWVLKLSETGELLWQKTLGGSYAEVANDIIQASDGGYVVTGYVGSNDGQITGYHGLVDNWVVKLNPEGELQWQIALGGSQPDYGRSIVSTSDGNYIIFGHTESSDGDVIGNDGGAEFWLVKVDSSGHLIWQKTYGGNMAELGFAICKTSDNGFALAGYSWSANNGDLIGSINHGEADFWIVKLAPETVGIQENEIQNASPLAIYPNPAAKSISLQLPQEIDVWTVTISNMLGQTQIQKTIRRDEPLDVSTLARGLYILQAASPDGKTISGKLEKT